MKTVTLALQKGGVGKTSLSMALAGELASMAGPVLIIDADPQGNTSGQLYPEFSVELADLLFDIADGKTPNLKEAVNKTSFPGLSIIGTLGLEGRLRLYAETLAAGKPNAVKQLVRGLAEWGFRYIIFDTSPAWGPLEKSILLATDEVITPTQGDTYGPDGLTIFSENIRQLRIDYETERPQYNRIIFNGMDKRIPGHERVLNELKKNAAGLDIYVIPTDPIFRRAQDASNVIQSLAGAKAETKAELARLAKDIF
jgi:chromosome partitioning protein